jgi:hypothetical protein
MLAGRSWSARLAGRLRRYSRTLANSLVNDQVPLDDRVLMHSGCVSLMELLSDRSVVSVVN